MMDAVLSISRQIGDLQIQRLTWSIQPAASPTTGAGKTSVPRIGVEGEISPFDNNFSLAHARLQRLKTQLQAILPAGYQIRITRWPLDTQPGSELEGEFGHSQTNARFQIEISGDAQ